MELFSFFSEVGASAPLSISTSFSSLPELFWEEHHPWTHTNYADFIINIKKSGGSVLKTFHRWCWGCTYSISAITYENATLVTANFSSSLITTSKYLYGHEILNLLLAIKKNEQEFICWRCTSRLQQMLLRTSVTMLRQAWFFRWVPGHVVLSVTHYIFLEEKTHLASSAAQVANLLWIFT